jgi:hypothetical protein
MTSSVITPRSFTRAASPPGQGADDARMPPGATRATLRVVDGTSHFEDGERCSDVRGIAGTLTCSRNVSEIIVQSWAHLLRLY